MSYSFRSGQLRIIGGQWRSRILRFPSVEGLRPTPDRVRETLFNWLADKIMGATCLDVFAGSGALGFEALSRGASWVTMIDQSAIVANQLRENVQLLDVTERVAIYCGRIPQFKLPVLPQPFDIVFLDPPFHHNWLPICCTWLEKLNCLAKNALIYIEAESQLPELPIPGHWEVLRSKKAGQVRYGLVSV